MILLLAGLQLFGCSQHADHSDHPDEHALLGEFSITQLDDGAAKWRLTVKLESWEQMQANGTVWESARAAIEVGFTKVDLIAQGCRFTGSRRELNGDIRLEGTCRWSGAKIGDRRI